MAKKLPEMFEYGELERTRKNIGEISEEEARKLKEKLGGQLGLEKAPQEVEASYERLRQKTLEKNASGFIDRPLAGVKKRSRLLLDEKQTTFSTMKFRQRWKLDWYLTRHEYRAKSMWQVLSLIWNRRGTDLVHRDWILDVDRRWFRSLENLVIAVRGLTARQHKNALQSLRRIPLFYNLLRVIREWDVEAIGRQLEVLQSMPHRLNFGHLTTLAQLVLRPFYLLSLLDPGAHLQAALSKMYDLARMYGLSEHEQDRLRKYYIVARDEIPLLFPRLKTHFYPVLIKNLAHEFLTEESFYPKYHANILEFLGLESKDLLRQDAVIKAEPLRRDVVPEPIEDQRSTEEEKPIVHPGKLAARGRDLLEKLFPESGFSDLTNRDFWAYFSPLFNFPRGSELIAPDDPLGLIFTLAIIVDQFFFGLENFRLNSAFNPTGNNISPRKQLDQLSAEWRRALNEIFSRRYLNELVEYCRTLELSGPEHPNLKRYEEQLYWIRKNGILPHAPIPLLKDIRPQPLGAIPLFLLTAELNQFLLALAIDTEKALKSSSQTVSALLNPLEFFKFDIDSALSRRLHSYFKKVVRLYPSVDPYMDNRTNRNYLFVNLAVVQYLDFLLNNPGSPSNQTVKSFHRRLEKNDPRPIYNPQQIDSPKILVNANHLDAMNQKNNQNLPVEDDLADFYAPWLFNDQLKQILNTHHSHQPEGGLAVVRLFLGKDIDQESLNLKLHDELAETFEGQSIIRKDRVFQILFKIDESLAVARLKDFAVHCAKPEVQLPIHVILVGFHRSISLERLMHLVDRGLMESAQFPPQVLGVYDHAAGAFQFAEDLPLCEVSNSEAAPQEPDRRS